MANDTIKTRMTSVILRATLALIFIWHGLDKVVSAGTEWGAAWAYEMWRHDSEPPPAAADKLAKLSNQSWLTESEIAAKLPDEQVQELAAQRRKLTQEQLNSAFALNAPPVPGLVSLSAVQYAVAWGELLGGLSLLIGLLTRLAAVGLILIQLGAIYFVTGPQGMSGPYGFGYEFNVALVAMCLAVLVLGPGAWSIDKYLHWELRKAAQKTAEAPKPPEPVAAPG